MSAAEPQARPPAGQSEAPLYVRHMPFLPAAEAIAPFWKIGPRHSGMRMRHRLSIPEA